MALFIDKLLRQATATLTPEQVTQLRPFGTVRTTDTGDVLFESGDSGYALFVILAGRTEIIDRSDGMNALIKSSLPGEFDGELGLLTGQTAFATCVVREPGQVLEISRAGVREIIATVPEIGDLLVTAFAARRQLLLSSAASSLTLIGPEFSAGIERLQEFTTRNHLPYRTLTPDDPLARSVRERFQIEESDDVWAIVRGQYALKNPHPLKVAKAIGLDLAVDQREPVDLIVIGAGPAGLSAAVYAASEGLSTIVVDDLGTGGQAGASSRIENYLGFPTGISGRDLAFLAEVQALKFGARVTTPRRVTSIVREGNFFTVLLDNLTRIQGRAVVIATGARYRHLGLPEQDRYIGSGMHYAATELEARTCQNDEVIVVGGGNSAGQAAMFLSRSASTVHLVCRSPSLERSMSHYLIARLEHAPNVKIYTSCTVSALHGDERLTAATVLHNEGEQAHIDACALFVMVGADPQTNWLAGTVALDEDGFVLTGLDLGDTHETTLPLPFQTSTPGIFAVGDVRSGAVKRVASAVGEGAVVVPSVHRYLTAARLLDAPGSLSTPAVERVAAH